MTTDLSLINFPSFYIEQIPFDVRSHDLSCKCWTWKFILYEFFYGSLNPKLNCLIYFFSFYKRLRLWENYFPKSSIFCQIIIVFHKYPMGVGHKLIIGYLCSEDTYVIQFTWCIQGASYQTKLLLKFFFLLLLHFSKVPCPFLRWVFFFLNR